MKYVCVNNKYLDHPLMMEELAQSDGLTRLTQGKIYEGHEYDEGIEVVDDSGQKWTFVGERFIMLRDYNLEKLGI